MTGGSLFAGIGGFDLAMERCGIEVKWQVEIDEYATRVLERHWPDVRRWQDVRTFPSGPIDDWRVDIICGGFPCQDISDAGRRVGIEGERSGLWSEFARVIGILRPKYAFVENVAALLHRGVGRVLGDLSSLGYDAEWHVIPAASVGAPHLRERVWILAYANCDGRFQVGIDKRKHAYGTQDTAFAWQKAKRCEDRISFEVASRNCLARMWTPQSGLLRVLDGVPNRVDRLRCLGNAIVPQCAEFILRQIVEHEKERNA